MDKIFKRIDANRKGAPSGMFSVCSANALVLEATLRHACEQGSDLVILEATSNQVNQDGGYTGMRPADYADFVAGIAQRAGFNMDNVVLGGDHLGPNAWQGESAQSAMAKAEIMIDQYVSAGFRKIHLDCSMSCADDSVPLPDSTVAKRAARLCRVAEAAYEKSGGAAPVYIIGTEVPVPGGAADDLDELVVTTQADAEQTIQIHKAIFDEAGLQLAWPRVIAAVVQPGVEFDHHNVIDYDRSKTAALSATLNDYPRMVFEAHSTDYQTRSNLTALVEDRFAILKVGPGVTFALREAYWALDSIEKELCEVPSGFREIAISVMKSQPKYWAKYYEQETEAALHLDLQYSLSDRIRYYWPVPEIEQARAKMFENLNSVAILPELVSQYLPQAYHAMRAGRCGLTPEDLVIGQLFSVLDDYNFASNRVGAA